MPCFQTVLLLRNLLQTIMSESDLNLGAKIQRPIVLIGMMGSGKTRIGSILAKKLGLEFIDSDARIEQSAGLKIPDIFEKYGETEFRRLEKRVIENILSEPQIRILSLGGGAILNAETAALVKEKCFSVWIKASFEDIWERVSQNSSRPLLACENPREVLRNLMKERKPFYANADCHVSNENDNAVYTIKQITEFLQTET